MRFETFLCAGVGEKIILREALRQLGLGALATKEKRAIQFGSHIGKLTNKRQFGSNRAANKQHAGSVSEWICQGRAGSEFL